MSTRSALHGRALSVGWHTMDPRPVSERSNSSPAPASQRSMKDETGGLPKQRGQQGLGEPMAGLSWGVGPLGLALPRTSFIRLGRVPFHLNDQDALGSAGLNVSARFARFPCSRSSRSTSHVRSRRKSQTALRSLPNTRVYPDRRRAVLLRSRRGRAPAGRCQSKHSGFCPRLSAARLCLPARGLCTWSWPVVARDDPSFAAITSSSRLSGCVLNRAMMRSRADIQMLNSVRRGRIMLRRTPLKRGRGERARSRRK
jgi:hypothetical protein